ncbi:hypothetical protein RJ639_039647 [Escallonia herrerae]|uniref:Protein DETOXIFICATION n=1 Tax=Escallonia herrerae TaxID=1293975 RepID=A0AA88X0N4_9ASTE|nr:hypothetical protein RJ639_039647 [Escallonia herrerae]
MGSAAKKDDEEEALHHQPLLVARKGLQVEEEENLGDLKRRVWVESKKLWHIVGPSIFFRIASNSMNIVTQVFAGHLGNLELASISIANNVIVGFNFGLLLGMASALETLCGQAFGAKNYHLLGIYMQRSWIVLFFCCFLLLPLYIFASPVLKLLGQPDDVAEQSGLVALWFIPLHFSFAFQFPLQRFLQSQLKTSVLVWVSLLALVVHVFVSWLFIYQLHFGVVGAAIALDVSWWVLVFGMLCYTICGRCGETWTGLSIQAFSGLCEFLKLSAASGVMLCLENWYYRILILMTGFSNDTKVAVDALSVCMSINGWEMMFALAFFAGTGVRVANELGAGNGKAAKFATKVSVVQSTIVGVAVGSGWQTWVAYINVGCYYLIGLPVGIILGWIFHLGVEGIWGGMIFGGTALQTIVLAMITVHCNWEKEAEKATMHVQKWSSPSPNSQPSIKH